MTRFDGQMCGKVRETSPHFSQFAKMVRHLRLFKMLWTRMFPEHRQECRDGFNDSRSEVGSGGRHDCSDEWHRAGWPRPSWARAWSWLSWARTRPPPWSLRAAVWLGDRSATRRGLSGYVSSSGIWISGLRASTRVRAPARTDRAGLPDPQFLVVSWPVRVADTLKR